MSRGIAHVEGRRSFRSWSKLISVINDEIIRCFVSENVMGFKIKPKGEDFPLDYGYFVK